MPVEFLQQEPSGGSSHATRLVMMYDGSGRRISKTAMRMVGDDDWDTTLVTHYTGIGTEIREYKPRNFVRYTDSAGVEHCVSANPDYGGNASTACPLPDTVKAVIPLPHGLGRYALQDADHQAEEGSPQAFEWYLKNHLGSTMLVYGTGGTSGGLKAAYDYRSFGEQIELTSPSTGKVTENFTGKELDDETGLSYHEARYLDPMLGVWISVDPKRFFPSPYLYMGNGYNPISSVDTTGKTPGELAVKAAIAAPSALYNMYEVQEKLSEKGASWAEMSIKGAAVLFGTLFISIIAPNSDKPIAAGFLGAGTALTTNAISQKYIEEKPDVDLKELGNAAKNGFLIGTSTAVGKAAASTIFIEPTSGFIGDAVGVTTEIIIDKCEDK